MDVKTFDARVRRLAAPRATRRGAIGLALVATLVAIAEPAPASAGVGCRNLGKPCTGGNECCSGVCRGKKGKKRCRAHDAGTCLPGENVCAEGLTAVCNDTENCYCLLTSGKAPFCGTLEVGACTACRRDADCAAQGFPPGSACIEAVGEFCPMCPAQNFTTACIAPCGTEPPVSPAVTPALSSAASAPARATAFGTNDGAHHQ